MITVVAGGVGAARFLRGLLAVVPHHQVTAVVNVADDIELHGLHVSPDIDTVIYTLADAVNPETGWGLVGETWNAMEALERYHGVTWFRLGDRDLATHLHRTQRLREGAPLSQATGEIARAWGLGLTVLPASDDLVRTLITLPDGQVLSFQEYFVRERHAVEVASVAVEGADLAVPAPGVLDALEQARTVVIAPSNPIVSIGPVLAVPGIRAALEARRETVVAVSPLVGGAALKGPADRLMRELGHESSVVGVARLYARVAGTLVIDEADAHLADAVEEQGVRCVVTSTVMADPSVAAQLARTCLATPSGTAS